LTFDINHFEPLKHEEILAIEKIVKEKINEALPVVTHVLPIEEAKKLGAMMLFGEKYGDTVRVVDINKWSLEFCGGTHVNNTKDIVEFAITSVESIGSGIYRFEGTTNNVVESSKEYLASYLGTLDQLLTKKQELTKSESKDNLPLVLGSYQDILNYREAIVKLQNEVKDLEKKAETDLVSSILKNADNFIP